MERVGPLHSDRGSKVRPRRTAAERRAQRRRATGRAVQQLLRAFEELTCHRGCMPSRLGRALQAALHGSQSAQPGMASSAAPDVARTSAPASVAARVSSTLSSGLSLSGVSPTVVVPTAVIQLPIAPAVRVAAVEELAETAAVVDQGDDVAVKRRRVRTGVSAWRIVGTSADAKVFAASAFTSRPVRDLIPGHVVHGVISETDLLGQRWVALDDGTGFVAISTTPLDFPGLGLLPARLILEEIQDDFG